MRPRREAQPARFLLQFLKRAFCVGRLCSDHADLARREWSPCRPPVLVQWRDEDLVFRHRSEADQFHRLSLGQNGVDGNAPEQLRKLEAFATHRAIASSIVVTVDEDLAPEFRCARLLSLFEFSRVLRLKDWNQGGQISIDVGQLRAKAGERSLKIKLLDVEPIRALGRRTIAARNRSKKLFLLGLDRS